MMRILLVLVWLLSAWLPRAAGAVTLYDGDYAYLPDQTEMGLVYAQHVQGDEQYINGKKVSDNAKFSALVHMYRYVKYIDIGDYAIVPQFLLPVGQAQVSGDLNGMKLNDGVGDLLLVLPLHFIKDPTGRDCFAITPWLWLPSGDYDADAALNPFAENRWKVALQVGRTYKASEKLSLEAMADIRYHGKNDDFNGDTLTQAPQWEVQTHLRYFFSPRTYMGAMLTHIGGGKTKLNGAEFLDAQSLTKTTLSIGHMWGPNLQLVASVGKDIAIHNGIKESTAVNLRLMTLF